MEDYSSIDLSNFDKVLKFRTLNRDHNFLFLLVKNSIEIYEPIKLNLLYTFHLDDTILNFEISPVDSSVVLNTKHMLERYYLKSNNLHDYDLKIKYERSQSKNIENIQDISISSLGDLIAVIDRLKTIRILNKDLEILKNISLELLMVKNLSFPVEFFNFTYDTKNVCLCRFGQNMVTFVYKQVDLSEDNKSEYAEKTIYYKDNILYLKEMQKELDDYLVYPDSSIFFMLTEGLNFLILRKTISQIDNVPNLVILSHIDLSVHTEYINFPSISFSLLYNNENPIFKTSNFDAEILSNLKSGFINIESWTNFQNKNSIVNDGFFNLSTYEHKNVSKDYLVFHLKEGLVLNIIEGLYSHPYNNLFIETFCKIPTDNNFCEEFLLIKMTKTLDRRYCLYFLDDNLLVRKYQFKNEIESGIWDSEKMLKIFKNIQTSDYNDRIHKTIILEYQGNNSLIFLKNSKQEIARLLVVKDIKISDLQWIQNTNYIIFIINQKIAIINFFSKFFDNKIIRLDEQVLVDKHILLNNFPDIQRLKLNNNFLVEALNKHLKTHDSNEAKFSFLVIETGKVTLADFHIESSGIEVSGKEFFGHLHIRESFERSNQLELQDNYLFTDHNLVYYKIDKTKHILTIKEYKENKNIFQVLLLEELLYSNVFLNNYLIFISKDYILTYDYSNSSFYRVTNNLINKQNFEGKLDLLKIGIFVYIVYITSTGILFVRIPINKNRYEEFRLVFNFPEQITNTERTNLMMNNNLIALNEAQIESISTISKLKHNMQFECHEKILFLINSNPVSLFDLETFLDFFLSNDEEIVKLILNIFSDLCMQIGDYKESFKSSKLIPNFYRLENINYLIKIIFENQMDLSQKKKLADDEGDLSDLGYRSSLGANEKVITESKLNPYSKQASTIIKTNPHLKFKVEEDDQTDNPINNVASNPNLVHLKTIYDVVSSENTRNVDNFTKYFILKIRSVNEELENDTFKLSTADLCWISFINDQEYLLKFLSKDKSMFMTWKFLKRFSIPLWIKNDYKLKELLETVGKNEYKLLQKKENHGDSTQKNYAEYVALYFYLANKSNMIIELYGKEFHNSAIRDFLLSDFKKPEKRKAAIKNARSVMEKKKFILAAYLFLLGGDLRVIINFNFSPP